MTSSHHSNRAETVTAVTASILKMRQWSTRALLMTSLQEEVEELKEQTSAVGSSSEEFEELRTRAEIAERMVPEASWEVKAPQVESHWVMPGSSGTDKLEGARC